MITQMWANNFDFYYNNKVYYFHFGWLFNEKNKKLIKTRTARNISALFRMTFGQSLDVF